MVMVRRLFFLAVLGLSVLPALRAQNLAEFRMIVKQNPIEKETAPRLKLYPSEWKTIMIGSLRFYQMFIATQDMNVCNFTPSCSHFAQEAFQNLSPIRALLLASDRLLRDNPWVRGHYPENPKTGRFSDPLDDYIKLIEPSAGKTRMSKRKGMLP